MVCGLCAGRGPVDDVVGLPCIQSPLTKALVSLIRVAATAGVLVMKKHLQ